MAIGRKRRAHGGIEAWPGYVDALSTLLMVLIFVPWISTFLPGLMSATY